MKQLFSYLKSSIFQKNALIALGSLLGFLIILAIYLRIYTHHNRSILVPDFTDTPLAVAQEQILDRKLRFEIFDSIYVAGSEPGAVIDQHPRGGALVKKGRKVYLTINAMSPEKVIMPNLVGITLREARTKIAIAGFALGKLRYRYDMAKNVVLQQESHGKSIEPGDTILKGSVIDLVLGKGLSDQKTMVPSLVGMPYEKALIKATDAFFTVSAPIPDESVAEEPGSTPIIYRQHPAHHSGILAPLGTQITLWVTCDSTKLSGHASADTADYAWPDLNEADDAANIETTDYDYDTN